MYASVNGYVKLFYQIILTGATTKVLSEAGEEEERGKAPSRPHLIPRCAGNGPFKIWMVTGMRAMKVSR